MAQVKTRVNRSGWVTVSEQCNHVLILPGGYQRHQALVRPRWDQRHEVPMGTRETRSGEAMLRIRVTS